MVKEVHLPNFHLHHLQEKIQRKKEEKLRKEKEGQEKEEKVTPTLGGAPAGETEKELSERRAREEKMREKLIQKKVQREKGLASPPVTPKAKSPVDEKTTKDKNFR